MAKPKNERIAELRQRRDRGIVLLDQRYANNWRMLVSAERLDMDSPFFCIGGQLEGRYASFMLRLGLDSDEAVSHGFDLTEQELEAGYNFEELTEVWQEVL